jgi:oxalate decarboxylase
MSSLPRRDFLAGAAAFAAATALAAGRRAETGELSFLNNVPDPLLSGKELPTFKFALEKSKGKVIGGSYGKEATVEQLPISKGLAGVSMKLEPGAMRELHWHATAAEWAFVIEGRVRTSVITPQGQSEINDFNPGDVWYFPRGHGHLLECLGDKPCHFILIFDNGYFSEFGTFSITDWLGHTPKALLAKNFGLPESAFDGFPKEEVYFARGKQPPEQIPVPLGGRKLPPLTHKYELMSQKPYAVFKGGKDLDDRHRRGPGAGPRGPARAALAPHRGRVAVRHRRPDQRDTVRLARPLPDRDAGEGGRRLHPAGLRPLHRERGREILPSADRFQHRPLRDNRPVAVDRR